MPRLLSCLFAMLGVLVGSAIAARAENARAYISVFQSGQVIAANTADGTVVRSILVQDGNGIAAVASNATRLFIVDGPLGSRLRVFDPKTFSVLTERGFDNRVQNFSDVGQLHLSRDGNWLFVQTYSYPDAAHGLRIFDVERGEFVVSGLRERACPRPVLASTGGGSLFALCPGVFQDMSPRAGVRGDFPVLASVAVQPGDILAAVATPDGRHLYAVVSPPREGRWQLVHWDRARGLVEAHDLASIVELPAGSRRTWLGIAPDARQLVMARDADLWLIDRESLKLNSRVRLPSPALSVDTAPGNAGVVTLHAASGEEALKLVTTPLSGGSARVVTVQTGARATGPAMLSVSPAN